ncbi:MAG: ABC transporter permease [Parvularculaceae bacterium]
MRLAVFEAMLTTLWRDRPAFVLTFVLPPTIFAIFALAFSGAAGGDLKVNLAIAAGPDDLSQELAETLAASPEAQRVVRVDGADALREAVRSGVADAGGDIARAAEDAPPRFVIYEDATRAAAALAAEKALARLAPAADEDAYAGAALSRERVNPANRDAPMAAYYVAGVAMLFLFLSGFQSALTLIEERDAGLMERIAAGPGGAGRVVDGKFAFILCQGAVQSLIIVATAWAFFGVEFGFAPHVLAAALLAAAFAAAGLTLGVTCLCRSKAQAHAVGVILSLVLAALGGSMAPAFLMPDGVRALGATTPNALGVEAFGAALWRGGGFAAAAAPIGLLTAYGLAGLGLARLAATRALARP